MTHAIRLRGHWSQETLEPGRIRHARSFGQPRTLSPNERIWIVCDHVPGPGSVTLNGQLLGMASADSPWQADITPLMLPRNQIRFDLRSSESQPLGEVRLEIREIELSTS